jgi:hypothetical protein
VHGYGVANELWNYCTVSRPCTHDSFFAVVIEFIDLAPERSIDIRTLFNRPWHATSLRQLTVYSQRAKHTRLAQKRAASNISKETLESSRFDKARKIPPRLTCVA